MRLLNFTAILAIVVASAQSQSKMVAPEFEVASIKPEPNAAPIPIMRGGPGTSNLGKIHYSGVTLMTLLVKAYGVYSDQIIGPRWLITEKYTVDAIVPAGTTQKQFNQMLQNLLVRRFKIVIQRSEKVFEVYNLVVADSGLKLKPSVMAGAETSRENTEFLPELFGPLDLDRDGCPVRRTNSHGAVGSVGTGNCTAFRQYSIPDFIETLEMMVAIEKGSYFGRQASQAHIVDKTGLKGEFDFNLKYNVSSHIHGSALEAPLTSVSHDATTESSIFEAIKKQRGLSLEKTKSRLGVLVIQQIANKTPVDN